MDKVEKVAHSARQARATRRRRGGHGALVLALCRVRRRQRHERRRLGTARRRRPARRRRHADQGRGLALPRPVDDGPERRRHRSPRVDVVLGLDRRAVRQAADAAPPLHQPGDRRRGGDRPADQRGQLLRLVVEPGARRRRPAAPARRVRALRDLRHLVLELDAAGAAARRGLVLRHAGREGLRQLPRPARRRHLSPDDGHLPVAPEEPEGRPDDRPRPRPQLRARGHAALHRRPVQAQPRRHDVTSAGAPVVAYRSADLERPVAGLHRPQLVRRPEPHRPHQLALLRRQPRSVARLAADAGLQPVHGEHELPLDQRQDLLRRRRSRRRRRPTPSATSRSRSTRSSTTRTSARSSASS